MFMQSGWVEIFFLAMLAGFIGLRLYHVLGRRTGHEKPAADPFRPSRPEVARPSAARGDSFGRDVATLPGLPADLDPDVRPGLEAVMQADRGFVPEQFLGGATSAYAQILESFWKGDASGLDHLVSDELLDNFKSAIAQRESAGEHLENRLIQVDGARIVAARMSGTMAEVTVRFDADIVAVTRNGNGDVVSGDPATPVETHDLWTFSRHTASNDPAWLLVATDEDA
jgi:predicted lipid-binding transport protein (Tim44 family)